MGKTNPLEIGKTYIVMGISGTVTGEILMAAGSSAGLWEYDFWLPVALAWGTPAATIFWNMSGKLIGMTSTPKKAGPPRGSYSRSIPFSSGGKQSSIMASTASWFVDKTPVGHNWNLSGQGRTIKYKEPSPTPEFRFWEDGMPAIVFESRLFDFSKMAWRRQQRVQYGDLRSNQVFSRPYFTGQARPRFPKPLYESIIYILETRDLLANRWRGKGGEMLFPPGITVEEAKSRW